MTKRRTIKRRKDIKKRKSFTRRARFIIYEALRARLPLSRAASLAGIQAKTVFKWIERGQTKDRPIYYEFRRRVKKIQTEHEREALDIIDKSARGGAKVVETKITIGPRGREVTRVRKYLAPAWQAAAWYLERRHRDDYGREGINKGMVGGGVPPEEYAKQVKEAADKLFNSVPLGAD